MSEPLLMIRVWGEFACFTRPETKVERVSYPVPTPSATRGVLESVFWKPEFSWRVEKIAVLKPPRYFSIVRNEIKDRQSFVAAQRWRNHGGSYCADGPGNRAQRHTLALRDVDYLISARIVLRSSATDNSAKYRDQFRRRVRSGRCFATPYLGCREFSGSFGPPDGLERPIDLTQDLGPMLFDMDYATDGSGRAAPRFFLARLEHGVLHVPQSNYEAPRAS